MSKLYIIQYPECLFDYYVTEDGSIYDKNNNRLKIYESTNGYNYISLQVSSGHKMFSIDEIVLRNIVGHPIGANSIKHLDGNSRNNNVNNLKWIHEDEQWVYINDFDIIKNKYKISNFGGFENNENTRYPCYQNDRGYVTVQMVNVDGKIISQTLHRLVALNFVVNPKQDEYTEINHIDGNKTNNHWKNLEWVSHKMNMQHAYSQKMIYRPKGDQSYKTSLTNSQVHEICELFIKYYGRSESVFNHLKRIGSIIPLGIIQHIKHKESWSHISDKYWSIDDLNRLAKIRIHIICKSLLKNNGNTQLVLNDLLDIMPDLTKRFVEIVRQKEMYAEISDEYFRKGDFSNKLSKGDIQTIRVELYRNAYDYRRTYLVLKDKIKNLTPRKVQKIMYKLIHENCGGA